MFAKVIRTSILAFVLAAPAADIASARTAYDGSWGLTIMTQRGDCDASYHFQVQINNGYVSSPGLNKFGGRVSRNGHVSVSVSAGGKYAYGTGRLTPTAGRGRWSGHSSTARCSGVWSAQRY